MRIYTGEDIRGADLYTILHEPVSREKLMERAAASVTEQILETLNERGFGQNPSFKVFAGKGDNGADGRIIAGLLSKKGFYCRVLSIEDPDIEEVSREAACPDEIYIDALIGSGLKGPVRSRTASVIRNINGSGAFVISVDLPSGMPSEPFGHDGLCGNGRQSCCMVKADVTVAVEFPKLSMLTPLFGNFAGEIKIAPIGLCGGFEGSVGRAGTVLPEEFQYHYVDENLYADFVLQGEKMCRFSKFSHKGDNGHLLAVCGHTGMTGAALLAVSGALRSGCGLVTARIPASERLAMHVAHPSAIVSCGEGDCFRDLPENMSRFTSVCVGCGLGTGKETAWALERLFGCGVPMVIDADALNLVSGSSRLRSALPEGSVLTPHLGELERLTGKWDGEAGKFEKAMALAREFSSVVVVKGAHTMTVSPDGKVFFNSTGCSGMAKGGSGDVLAGYIGGLLARGYPPLQAAVTGVCRHGLAGERAGRKWGQEAMNASDLADFFCFR